MKIAIDGPSGAGKSTVAKALSKKLGIVFASRRIVIFLVLFARTSHASKVPKRAFPTPIQTDARP